MNMRRSYALAMAVLALPISYFGLHSHGSSANSEASDPQPLAYHNPGTDQCVAVKDQRDRVYFVTCGDFF